MKRLARWMHGLYRLYWRHARPVTVGVRCILERDGQVLLVRHTYTGESWYLPGGGVHRGETIEQAARREVGEEVGASLGALRLLGLYTNMVEGKTDHVAILACDDWATEGPTGFEVETWALFSPDRLPAGASPGTRRRIAEYAANSGPHLARW